MGGNGFKYNLVFVWLPKLALIVLAVLWAAPVVWMFVSSIKPEAAIFTLPPSWIPRNVTFEHYQDAMQAAQIFRWFLNSAIVTVVATALTLVLNAMAGYAFARIDFPLKNLLFVMVLATIMVPVETIIIPLYLQFDAFGLLNSYTALILPRLALPLGVFLLRQFFLGMPRELEEAAFVDGCSRFRLFWTVALPLAKPSMAALGIFSFIGTWNDFLWPLISTSTSRMYTLTVGIATLQGFYGTDYGMLMASAFIASLPVLIVFLLFQQHIVQGVAATGIKG